MVTTIARAALMAAGLLPFALAFANAAALFAGATPF
jgi:hypothetical protein